MNLFHIEGKYISYGAKLADLLWLNLLTLICCLPVFTIGASLTAMHYVLLQMVKDQESSITSSFFRSFRLNFRQSTVIWMILFVTGIILAFDCYFASQPECGIPYLFMGGLIILVLIWVLEFLWVFPTQCHYKNTIKNTMKNAIRLAIAHPVRSLKMLLASAAPVLLVLVWYNAFALLLLLGLTGPGIACATQYNRIFSDLDQGIAV